MRLLDELTGKVVGDISCIRVDLSGARTIEFEEHNVILDQSNEIFRDLMFGVDDARIESMGFGDLGLTSGDDIINVPPAESSDRELVRQVGIKPASMERVLSSGKPAIEYKAILDYQDMNGDGNQIITEYCMITKDGRAFNKKNRAAIVKSSEFRYEFSWTIRFL